ncbi:hypothetical protein AWB75_06794 [Caballeronia catudaia]|uniref:PAAR repeat-containing protein n=1 Tax=Caballeronia catudaia TaxID=1777136 RepID=A0A158DI68_9BURK|nr:hypothetical protein AWB75_06794 [Caballeronia catudaia]
MTDRLVGKGDWTTTRGRVLGGSSSFFAENGQTLSRRNDIATCGNCEGSFPILGTADTILDEGLPLVRHMDRVLCPCGQNRVISGHPEFLIRDGKAEEARASAGGGAPIAALAETAAENARFDEQLRATASSVSLDGYPYQIEMADGRMFSGRVKSGGALPRMMTGENADEYTVYGAMTPFDVQRTVGQLSERQPIRQPRIRKSMRHSHERDASSRRHRHEVVFFQAGAAFFGSFNHRPYHPRRQSHGNPGRRNGAVAYAAAIRGIAQSRRRHRHRLASESQGPHGNYPVLAVLDTRWRECR